MPAKATTRRPASAVIAGSCRSSAVRTGRAGGNSLACAGRVLADQYGGLTTGGSGCDRFTQRAGRQDAAIAEPGAAIDHQDRTGFHQTRVLQSVVHQQDFRPGPDSGSRAGSPVGADQVGAA